MADEKKRFLFVSIGALISDIAWQVVREGHDVRYFIESESENSIGDGFVPKVDAWEPHIDWADVIVFDDVLGMGERAQKLREGGKHVVGLCPDATGQPVSEGHLVESEVSVLGPVAECPLQHFLVWFVDDHAPIGDHLLSLEILPHRRGPAGPWQPSGAAFTWGS